MIRILGTLFAGLMGLAFGSFLNVCVSRWPAGESVVRPGSHCRNCGRTLAWWENLPLLSWLALRGQCRTCAARIGARYVLVEATVGALWACIAWRALWATTLPMPVSFSPAFLLERFAQAVLCWLLVALAVLDAENLWLPDFLTWPGIAAGLLMRVAMAAATSGGRPGWALLTRAGEALAAAAIILLIRSSYSLVKKREGIGLGDAKLMALLAAWLGLPATLLAFVVGVVLGAAVAVGLLAAPKARRGAGAWALVKLPLGTFLCVGGIVSALWGRPVIAAYLRWVGL